MSTTVRTTVHSFNTYSFNGKTVVCVTQFARDDYGDLHIISDMGIHLSKDEVKELIEQLQEALNG